MDIRTYFLWIIAPLVIFAIPLIFMRTKSWWIDLGLFYLSIYFIATWSIVPLLAFFIYRNNAYGVALFLYSVILILIDTLI